MKFEYRYVKYLLLTFILPIITITTLLVGCTNTQSGGVSSGGGGEKAGTVTEVLSDSDQNSYKSAIALEIKSRLHTDVDHVDVIYSESIDTSYVSQVLFTTKGGDKWEGNVYANRDNNGVWVIKDLTYTPINKAVPFTQLEMSGTGSNGNYYIISGVVNDKNIAYIHASFIDGLFTQIIVRPTNGTYAYVRTDSPVGLKELRGISKNGSLIYKY